MVQKTYSNWSSTKQEPNKALEPTSTSVMPRAILPSSDLKRWNGFPNQARVTPLWPWLIFDVRQKMNFPMNTRIPLGIVGLGLLLATLAYASDSKPVERSP